MGWMPHLGGASWKVISYLANGTYGSGKPMGLLTWDEMLSGRMFCPGLRLDSGTGLSPEELQHCVCYLYEAGLIKFYYLGEMRILAFGLDWNNLNCGNN